MKMSRKKFTNANQEFYLRTLITQITGFENEEENHDLCLKFVQSHVKYHRFLSVDSHKITRVLDGICTKFVVHSQSDKASILQNLIDKFLLSPLTNQNQLPKTDGHYGVLSLLLELSDSPTEKVFKEKPKAEAAPPEPVFDWGEYLLAGEDLHQHYFSDSTEDSEEDEDDVEESDSENVVNETSQAIGSQKDAKEWLLSNLVIQYWQGAGNEDSSIGRFPASNLHKNWESFQVNSSPFHVPRQRFLTELQLIREILWMLHGVESYVFVFDGRRFSVNQDVYLSHLTEENMQNYLQKFIKHGNQIAALESFRKDVVNRTCDRNDLTTVTQTYQAFVGSFTRVLADYHGILVNKETEVRKQDDVMTLSILSNDLESWFQKLELIYSIYISGTAAAAQLDSNIRKASHLLNVMFKTLIDYDTLGAGNNDKVSLLLIMWMQTCRPYFTIISNWITSGNLEDPREDFLIQRNKSAQSFDESFWEEAFILRLANKIDSSSSNISNDIDIADATSIPRFLMPVLKEITLTGKSMELLVSMGKADKVKKMDDAYGKPKTLYEIFVEYLLKMLGTKAASETEESSQREIIPECNIPVERIDKMLKVKGVYDPLLEINFKSVFNPLKLTENLQQGREDIDLKLLRSIELNNLHPLEIILQRCLYPYIQDRYKEVCIVLVNIIKDEFYLFQDLKAMRRFFLMEAGDTLFDFYFHLFDMIKHGEDWRDENVLGYVLEEALESQFSDTSHRLKIEVEPPSPEDKYPISLTNCIKLHYQVAWPANMVISQKYQSQYNEIFSFILQIKRAKYCLEQITFKDLERKDILKSLSLTYLTEVCSLQDELPSDVKIHRMQILRFRLLYFANSLHNYIMTRILHSTGLEFEDNLQKAEDLDEIIAAHVNYLHKIYHHCLLDPSLTSLKFVITKVLNLILVFHNYWQMGVDEISLSALQEMELEFSRCVQFLGKFLSSLIQRGSFPHLESLAFAMVTSMGKT